ncbi:hypothetical protein PR202_ga24480 [Eleusine coracana subsp. coracana]|uniref:Carboxypeptidase n=1 Tax=Eleusine coracana subsp. coracana TaxID=191504 RepID=A0AAV5D8X5_ELECO|nr:hypothetical protein PR202_ga24480 [Eleusine coracana subsp. coracana]
MAASWKAVALAMATVALVLAGTCVSAFPVEDLVTRLPGQPPVTFRQFAGYVDVDAKAGRSLFYYFTEAQEDAAVKPLTLWLNGVSNLLFVESPAGVGWSYSNTSSDYKTGDKHTAEDMYRFLLGWYAKFPEYRSRALFLTGESYAGHYIPQLTDLLLTHNEKSTGFKFNIKAVAIGNPLLKLDRDVPATYEYFWSHGMISDEIFLAISHSCNFEDYTFDSPHNESKSCNDAIAEANGIVGDYVNNYDVILDVCYPSIVMQELRLRKYITKISVGVDVCMTYERFFYFNLPEVQQALHANRTRLPYHWSMCSNVLNYSDTDGNINILPILQRIVEHKIPLWVFR